jgi:hypothetical protein
LLHVAVEVVMLVALVMAAVPHGEAVVVAVNTTPVPVGDVSTIVGGDAAVKHPDPRPS